jgi:hypothetical protein
MRAGPHRLTTVSIEPCAVCTMTGVSIAALAQLAEHAEPSRSASRGRARRRRCARPSASAGAKRRLAALGHDRLVAEAAHHRLEKPR